MSKIANAERLNKVNVAQHDLAKKLGRIPTHAEREDVRAKVDSELEAEGKLDNRGNGGTGGDPSVISQKDLLSMDLKPLAWLVDFLFIWPGLILFSGKKKLGKSLLILILALAIAGGKEFLGKKTRQGVVLFVSLEDGARRLQSRLQTLKATADLPITYITEIEPLNTDDGMAKFEGLLKTHKPTLTVIDTLISAVDSTLDENRAATMGSLMNQLHKLAMDCSTTIILISHHGKKQFFDPGFDTRGSSAIPSASDCNMSLYKAGDGCFDLKVEGRDLADCELRLTFDPDAMLFELKGDSRDERRAIVEDRIIEVIGEIGEADAAMIAKELDLTRMAVQHTCQRMRKDKLLDFKLQPSGKTKKIIYSLPETGLSTLSTLSLLNTENKDNDAKDDNEDNVEREIVETKDSNADNKENKDTPVSEVKTDTLPEKLPVEVIKNLGAV